MTALLVNGLSSGSSSFSLGLISAIQLCLGGLLALLNAKQHVNALLGETHPTRAGWVGWQPRRGSLKARGVSGPEGRRGLARPGLSWRRRDHHMALRADGGGSPVLVEVELAVN